MNTAVQVMSEPEPQRPTNIATINDSAALMAVIARAAADPACDLDKMERLMAMHERATAKQAEAQFAADLAEMQAELPSIGERGDAAGRYTFALWEDINTAIKPFLRKYGFSLSFRTDFTSGITVMGVLQHRSGHKETTSITLPADPSGNKNAVQAVASSVSYGKRYTAGALLNLTSHGEDDDAYAAGTKEPEPEYVDWKAAIDGESTVDGLKGVKKELEKKFGNRIPATLVQRCVDRMATIKAGAK
jgi:hypothetical protein